ncbi:putative prefoldin subunit 5 [Phakopsora pachyrhizi]|uniref:Prefoldin subunit 5 n=1 Tax=Phakopsora pachyrhizi TaxID=170000 RepID=I6UM88_PHAPC|nr:putative prefoldin subunit 5 [Phakopsora pachyrhizi]KAI8451876.1 putative prefoldin subunit 5 [Phakopsora pachyrhizi]CAH7673622.1 putative prefoldin subunit 5 [Phakopsora pachyrhizi]
MAQQMRNQVNVQDLEPDQLASVKEQLSQELVQLTNSFGQLKGAIAKFNGGIEAIESVKSKSSDQTILVPLTSSLYVPGKMIDTSRVMLDVGTGYLIDQPASTAKKSLNQKALSLSVNLDQLQSTIETKQENLSLVNELIQIKLNSSNNSNK